MSDIISTTDLGTFMNVSLNAGIAQQVVDGINQYVENRTNRCWGETATVNERRDWSPLIYTYHQDVTAVNSIILGYPNLPQTDLDPTSYFWNSLGRITIYLQQPGQYNPSSVNNDLVLINYTYGVTTVPEDLVMAVLGIAAHYYDWVTSGQKDVVSVSMASYKIAFSGSVRGVGGGADGNSPSSSMSTDQQNWDIIDSYRMRKQ